MNPELKPVQNPADRPIDNEDRLAFLELLKREKTRLHKKSLENPDALRLFNSLRRIEQEYAVAIPLMA